MANRNFYGSRQPMRDEKWRPANTDRDFTMVYFLGPKLSIMCYSSITHWKFYKIFWTKIKYFASKMTRRLTWWLINVIFGYTPNSTNYSDSFITKYTEAVQNVSRSLLRNENFWSLSKLYKYVDYDFTICCCQCKKKCR